MPSERALDDEVFQTDRQRLRKIPQPRAIRVVSNAKEGTTRKGGKRRLRVCSKAELYPEHGELQ